MENKQNVRALSVITLLFFLFGFLTCLNDSLLAYLKSLFTLNYAQAALLQFSFFGAYFVCSIPSSYFCERVGHKKGMSVGLLITGLGCIGFYLAGKSALYGVFLMASFVSASGIALIQVAANPYISLLGKKETASARLTIVQAFNSIGTTLAPFLGGMILAQHSGDLVETTYISLAVALVAIVVFLAFQHLPKIGGTEKLESNVTWTELFQNKRLMLGCLGIFSYVGAEVAIGSFMINWLGHEHVTSLDAATASRYLAFYWGGAMVGRLAGSPILAKYNPAQVLMGAVGMAALGVCGTMVFSGGLAQWSILSVGLFNSIMFPTIFTQSINGVSRGNEKAGGLLCTAIVGGAVIPQLQGVLADRVGLQISYLLPLACYIYLLGFSQYIKKANAQAAG